MSADKIIKFDYDSVNLVYNKLIEIQTESKASLDRLEKAYDEADKAMKGKYRKAFNDKKKDVFKDFKKTSVDGIKSLAKAMNQASKQMENIELEVIDNIKTSMTK